MTNALTFTDWGHYTDDGANARTLDWTDYAAMQGQFAYPYLEALRQAVNERTLLYLAPVPALAVGSPWTRKWAWTVLDAAISLAIGPNVLKAYWVKPALLPTLHNVQHYTAGPTLGAAIVDAAYAGLDAYIPGMDETLWQAALTRLLDDAGVTDAAFRAWAANRNHWTNEYLVPMASLLWNLKAMLSKLDTLVLLEIAQPADAATTSLVATGLQVTGGTSAGRAVHYEDATTWAAAVTAFNALAWAGTWPEEGSYWHTIGHKAKGNSHNITINRVRRTDSFAFPTMPSARVEFAGNLQWTGFDTFVPSDFAGLSGYAYDQKWLLEVQDTRDTSGSTEALTFGDYADCSLGGVGAEEAWLLGNYSLRLDFSGTYLGGAGFVFRA